MPQEKLGYPFRGLRDPREGSGSPREGWSVTSEGLRIPSLLAASRAVYAPD
jgi:hypothetical protein